MTGSPQHIIKWGERPAAGSDESAMRLELGTPVRCTDDTFGELADVVIDPISFFLRSEKY
jgi:hypothetical protein